MEDFLTTLYQEEQEKTASADMENFFQGLPAEELEAFLGVEKTAVAGPPEPEMPTSLPAKELDARMKAVDEYAQKAHEGKTPPSVEDSKSATSVSHQGESKVKVPVKATGAASDEPKTKTKKAAVLLHALDMARILPPGMQKAAMVVAGRQLAELEKTAIASFIAPTLVGAGVGAGIGAIGGEKGKKWQGVRKGALIGGALGLGSRAAAELGSIPGRIQAGKVLAKHPNPMSLTGKIPFGTPAFSKALKDEAASSRKLLENLTKAGRTEDIGRAVGVAAGGTGGGIGGAAIERKLREKTAGLLRPDQPTARELVPGRGPAARKQRDALRRKLRAGCPATKKTAMVVAGRELSKTAVLKEAVSADLLRRSLGKAAKLRGKAGEMASKYKFDSPSHKKVQKLWTKRLRQENTFLKALDKK